MLKNGSKMKGCVLLRIRCLPISKMLPHRCKRGKLHVHVFKHVTSQCLTDPHCILEGCKVGG